MTYNLKNGKRLVDYGTEEFQPCWTCKNACGGCDWSREFEPIKGWTAEKTIQPLNGEYAETYKIIKCPQYICDRRFGTFNKDEREEVEEDEEYF